MVGKLALGKETPAVACDDDSDKRHQIIEGARKVFLTKGFDAASMNDISRTAGVSKGTLYVYFENKEKLFEVICSQESAAQAEDVFSFSSDDLDVEATLSRLGIAFVNLLCRSEKASTIRTVVAIAERMPEIGHSYYESGAACAIARLADYIRSQIVAGVLDVQDPEIAAAQFIESCHATLFKPMIFNFGEMPSKERIEYCVGIAVRTFLAAYRVR